MSWWVPFDSRAYIFKLSVLAQSRWAVNAVTLGDFERPIRISIFIKDLFAGFSMVTY